MKTYQILLLDSVTNHIQSKVKDFKGTEKELRLELLSLQRSYCEGENPSVIRTQAIDRMCIPPVELNIMKSECESDYCYIAVL